MNERYKIWNAISQRIGKSREDLNTNQNEGALSASENRQNPFYLALQTNKRERELFIQK